MRTFADIDELRSATGTAIGNSDWHDVDQTRIDQFAEATGDHQWIHVDPERAKTDSPFGTTIAHGYLSLSLLPMMAYETYTVENVKMALNYGLNKVRFPAPVPCGSRLRAHFELQEVNDVAGGVQVVNKATIEIEGSEKPAAVAETVSLLFA
jgi:acyl dehydratase